MNHLNPRPLALLALIVPVILLFVACSSDDEELSRADVEEIVRAEMAEEPAPPQPEPGLSAADVEEAIRKAIADMPKPEPGPSRAEVAETVQAAIASMPKPEPVPSRAEVAEIVQAAIAAIPLPEAGLTSAQVEEAIRRAIADIPQPGPGLTADDVERIARSVVASVPSKSAPAEYTRFFVEKAINRYVTQGLDATLAYYSLADSVDGQWYVFIIDENGLVIAHPDSDRVGLDLNDWVGTDANGYNFGPDMLSATEEGKWVSYVYRNPESGGIGSDNTGTSQLKNVWVMQHDGLLFASGWYIDADEFTKALVATAARVFRAAGLEGTIAYFASPDIEFAGLRSAIEYYNSADNVEGDWVAFIADPNGTIIDHYDRELVGSTLEDLFGRNVVRATAEGNWVTTEDMRVWVVGDNGMTFGSGWRRIHDESGN